MQWETCVMLTLCLRYSIFHDVQVKYPRYVRSSNWLNEIKLSILHQDSIVWLDSYATYAVNDYINITLNAMGRDVSTLSIRLSIFFVKSLEYKGEIFQNKRNTTTAAAHWAASPWSWQWAIGKSLTSTRIDLNNLCHFGQDDSYEMWTYINAS